MRRNALYQNVRLVPSDTDGSSDTYTSAGTKSHIYADGGATYTVHVDLVDEDGTSTAAGTRAVRVFAPRLVVSADRGGPPTVKVFRGRR